MQPYFHHGNTTLFVYFQYTLIRPFTHTFICGHFVNFSIRRNKSLHRRPPFKTARSTAASFQVFLCQSQFITLAIWNIVDILLSLLSLRSPFAILQVRSSFYFSCLYFAVFSCLGHGHLTAIVFAARVAVPFFSFSLPFAAILIAMPFFSPLPSI